MVAHDGICLSSHTFLGSCVRLPWKATLLQSPHQNSEQGLRPAPVAAKNASCSSICGRAMGDYLGRKAKSPHATACPVVKCPSSKTKECFILGRRSRKYLNTANMLPCQASSRRSAGRMPVKTLRKDGSGRCETPVPEMSEHYHNMLQPYPALSTF